MQTKTLKYLCLSLLLTTLAVTTTGCVKDDEPKIPDVPEWENPAPTVDIADLVSKYVSAKVYYHDYRYDVTIESKLANYLPNKYIQYGCECGYGNYDYYTTFNDGSPIKGTIIPFVGDDYGRVDVYLRAYDKLMEKKANGESWDSEERDLYNGIIKILDEIIQKRAYLFQARLYVEVDGTRYFFYEFKYR